MTPPDALQVVRGGSWDDNPGDCRSAHRDLNQPVNAVSNIGFRVVCLPREAPPRMLLRGGCWLINPSYCRSARRDHDQPGSASSYLGFRVVCLPPSPSPNSPQT
jgi:formylglycine-generating enzyme required for sulfatase activity